MIDEMSPNKQIWDLLILVMAIFNSFAVPLEYVVTELETIPSYQMIDLIINILFIFDIVIGFRTTYFDPMGNKIRSPKLIAKKYIKGMFFVDFFSSIPYRYVKIVFSPIDNISFLKILKIARISRFGPFVQKLELNAEDKAVSQFSFYSCAYTAVSLFSYHMTNFILRLVFSRSKLSNC